MIISIPRIGESIKLKAPVEVTGQLSYLTKLFDVQRKEGQTWGWDQARVTLPANTILRVENFKPGSVKKNGYSSMMKVTILDRKNKGLGFKRGKKSVWIFSSTLEGQDVEYV